MNNGRLRERLRQLRGVLITALVFLAMVVALVSALSQVDQQSEQEQTKILTEAVFRATLTCYAIEGRYPPGAEYLKTHYGIVYNEDQYIVTLDSFASNVLPTIYVLVKGGGLYAQ